MASTRDPWNEISTVGVTPAPEAEGPPAPLTLHVIQGDVASVHKLPAEGAVAIGRGDGVEVSIADASISRRHAVLHLGAQPSIEDLGSANGTRVGGRAVPAGVRVKVAPGELLELGGLILVLHAASRGASARPSADDAPAVRSTPGEVVEDPAMKHLRCVIERIAPSAVSVLLLGETGTGKELLAAAVHRASPRHAAPFLRINCAAVQDTLFESELFGHERGAFTGATQAKDGLLEVASGGTVFLDEIGELALPLQAKLLRALEERQITRVGGTKPRTIDVRFVSATNRDLEAEVVAGRFRQDLFFRLDGIPLYVPPLRERPSEILPLARLFLAQAAEAAGRAAPSLAPETIAVLERHPFPGNVRELKNLVHRAVLLSTDVVMPEALALHGRPAPAAPATPDLGSELEAVEKRRILEVLARVGGNQSRAARELGISRNTLLARLRQYGVR